MVWNLVNKCVSRDDDQDNNSINQATSFYWNFYISNRKYLKYDRERRLIV